METLAPLEALYSNETGTEIPLPDPLARLYGRLRFPSVLDRPYVIANFVSTIDGVVTLGTPEKAGGNAISGSNRHDALVMGILRAMSDAIIVGSGNVAASPKHIWTAERVFPELAEEYRDLRHQLGKTEQPLNVIVSANINLDLSLPIFRSGKVEALIVTTTGGMKKISGESLPRWVRVETAGAGSPLNAREILEAVQRAQPTSKLILVEGGPHLMGTFFRDQALDELFLTLSPQVAGRASTPERLGLVAGQTLAPDRSIWGRIISVHRAENHLFLRYAFPR